ncbi:Thioredoxin-like fold protein [Moelleriella libera RCEF 2490]|uniref:Thioredoxin-like fold protein n=1 Tax=Moelleriella libera RCEF 2490 TaxID=1081109 RepID=A0A166UZ97_9HYPO|nr:Thioredoxin-like fold protein [Moelleriella libera RCEF 2490]
MAGGHVDCYLDISSFYSYVCFVDLLPNLDKLAAHKVHVDFHPVFLGAINHLSGNQPPWTLPAKARYLARDARRAASRVGIATFASPPDLLRRARTQSALRALLFIKATYPPHVFLSAFYHLLYRFWTAPNADVVADDDLAALLAEATELPLPVTAATSLPPTAGGGRGGKRLFGRDEVARIMDGRAGMKKKLVEDTTRLVEEGGAFGCPWFLVTNAKGSVEPVFGSDR